MQQLNAADGNVTELAFAPDGRALAAVILNHTAFLWDIPAGEPRRLFDERSYHSHDIVYSPDSNVVSWLVNQKRMEFDRKTAAVREVPLTNHPVERLNGQIRNGPDDRLVVRTVQNNAGFRIRCFTGDKSGGWKSGWSVGPDWDTGSGAIVGTATDRFFTWEAPREYDAAAQRLVLRSALTGEIVANTPVPTGHLFGLAARADATEAAGFANSSLVAWRPGEKPRKVRAGTRAHFRAITYHPSGKYLLAANNDNSVRVFDTDSWTVVKQYAWAIGHLSAVAVSPDGALAAAGGRHGQIVVWDFDL
jgi:WD40 repeat protein